MRLLKVRPQKNVVGRSGCDRDFVSAHMITHLTIDTQEGRGETPPHRLCRHAQPQGVLLKTPFGPKQGINLMRLGRSFTSL